MRVVTLERISFSDNETVGILKIVGTSFKSLSIERPWKNNEPFVSCIPASTYVAKRDMYNKPDVPYETFKLVEVPERTQIKFHSANKGNQVQGCIAPGNHLFVMDKRVAVANSWNTFKLFMAHLVDETEVAIIISERR